MFVTVSAPGKIHLLGEHSVVYGKPALLAAIDRRLSVHVREQTGGSNEKEPRIHGIDNTAIINQSIRVFIRAFRIEALPPLEITVTSGIPTSSGLGSSAAVAAATIGALMKYVKNLWNPTKVNELVMETEKYAHGNPSGADNTTIVFGGLIWYRKEFDFLRSVWSLPLTNYTIPPFLLLSSGKPKETTKEMVALVARHLKEKPALNAVIEDQETQTKRLLLALRGADRKALISAIRQGEKNLERLGVVGKKAKALVREIENEGGAAKISGAGGLSDGSGILLCYHSDHAIVKRIAQKYLCECNPVVLGAEGIRLEKTERGKT